MICVLFSCASFVVKDFKAAFVAQNMNAGVLILPWGVDIIPVLAFELLDLFLIDQLKSFISFLKTNFIPFQEKNFFLSK